MENRIKKLILKRTVFWIISSLIFSLIIYVLSGSISVALIVGFAFFFYSLSAIYIYYQYISREVENKEM
ncbi:MAG: hypothetical protein HY035_05820 [Nitrospirae bacterium]|nr:hypothetical protein [Nitrospirota bacterium]MBI3377904.1 hypothetical protein [Nitrospirota bacterium]